jgi:hypothetical protein
MQRSRVNEQKLVVSLAALVLVATCSLYAAAQATPTATQNNRLSAFGSVTGTYTGLEGGKNLGLTVGADLSFPSLFSVNPSFELRGTYPIDKGTIDNQKNILAGLRIEKRYGHFHPYANILFGRGRIDYKSGGIPDPSHTFLYLKSTSNVISPGIGVDFDISSHLAVKADAQLQHYSTPITTSGHLYAKPITLGVVYNFDFNHHRHSPKQ